jgi:hypothetical protein
MRNSRTQEQPEPFRVLGKYVREDKVIDLITAIEK